MIQNQRQKIRVGLIRCDTHAAWYGALMAEHDPWKLRSPVPYSPEWPYSWMNGGVHCFHYSHYANPTLLTCPFAGGFQFDKVWDPDRRCAEAFRDLFEEKPVVCSSPDEVSDGVDLVFIADCNGDGADHFELAGPGLRKGIATFVDKPMATTLADARKMAALAAECGSPLLSASILQFHPQVHRFRSRLAEVGVVDSGTITGHTMQYCNIFHSVAAAHTLFGGGVREVRCLPAPGGEIVHLSYGDHPERPASGLVIHCGEARYRWTTFKASAYGRDGDIHAEIYNDYYGQHGTVAVIEEIRKMVLSRSTPDVLADTIEITAVMDAAVRSRSSGFAEVDI